MSTETLIEEETIIVDQVTLLTKNRNTENSVQSCSEMFTAQRK